MIFTITYFEWIRLFDYFSDERTYFLVISDSVQAVGVWYKSYSVRGWVDNFIARTSRNISNANFSITLYSDYMNRDVL